MKKLSLLLIPLLLSSCGVSDNKIDKYFSEADLKRHEHWEEIDYTSQYLYSVEDYYLFYYGNKNAVYDIENDEYHLFKRPKTKIEDILELTPGIDSFLNVIEKVGFPNYTAGNGVYYYCYIVEDYVIHMRFERNINYELTLVLLSGELVNNE